MIPWIFADIEIIIDFYSEPIENYDKNEVNYESTDS